MSKCLRCGAGNEWIEPIGATRATTAPKSPLVDRRSSVDDIEATYEDWLANVAPEGAAMDAWNAFDTNDDDGRNFRAAVNEAFHAGFRAAERAEGTVKK